ncbi:Mu transposase C-terminal domain-containing protein [Defluviimonas sp. WL0024]|uniref:Mu transposase C-terminal domain-containing protein n=1 Tax=Albidovulum salinarum TaxID=2984153 RepID=A0ABT2X8V0_9RHOB|nr:transposase domain-containing protein [Defluviimonas sp. WL0024]MCU9850380.1 Mu transposase C-terminal domain-containing protein [Defluviimonas sp. WL0024]
MNIVVDRENWRQDPHHARRREGRGGGWEYHWKLFPSRAQKQLLATVAAAPTAVAEAEPRMERDEAWSWFEGLPEKAKGEAQRRLLILQKVEALSPPLTRYLAAHDVATLEGVSARSIWNWFALIEGVRPDDRLPYLAPRHRAAERKSTKTRCDREFMEVLKSDFLRSSRPSFTSCHRRAVRIAKANGWRHLPERTARRRLDAEVSIESQTLARKGMEALKRLRPTQTRDKTALHAMEAVNADFHKFDVFVRWPAERGEAAGLVTRPQMVAFQDIHSGRILSWRVDQTPNSYAVQLAAGDMIESWGIPEHVLFDNGREFAAKTLTGGTPTRFRFRVREDDLPGLFVSLGCQIHWATPYSGQSKPIERAFRDMCDAISKDPRFDGAWTGNRPDAKPEDYGSRAIELEDFLAVVAEGIEEHNTRQGRRSEVAFGRSFAEVFDASYATAPIRKATEAQRRFWLMGAEGLKGATGSGQITFSGNKYWAPWMSEIAGEQVIARFDLADLWAGLHVYSADNEYLGRAPCMEKVGFQNTAEARALAKARRGLQKADRAALEAHRKFKAAELGSMLDDAAPAPAEEPAAKVVRPVFGKGKSAPPAESVVAPEIERAQAEIVADLASRRPKPVPEEPARERFRRALELERAAEAGAGTITPDQWQWLQDYQQTPEYRSERMLWEDFGDAIFG